MLRMSHVQIFVIVFLFVVVVCLMETSFGFVVIQKNHKHRQPAASLYKLKTNDPELIRQAGYWTSVQNENITAGIVACELWSNLLYDDDDPSTKNDNVLEQTCVQMYISSLIRCGRDHQAIPLLDQLLSSKSSTTNIEPILEQRAKCHLRLLNYARACHDYQQLLQLSSSSIEEQNNDKCIHEYYFNIVKCYSRINEYSTHQRISSIQSTLHSWYQQQQKLSQSFTYNNAYYLELWGLCTLFLGEIKSTPKQVDNLLPSIYKFLLQHVSENKQSPKSKKKWFSFLEDNSNKNNNQGDWFSSLVAVNVSPLDIHSQLISLDDKVYLHKLLSSRNATFWPNGIVLQLSSPFLQSSTNHSTNRERNDYMILKQRSGYGSFGNSIISKSQALHFLHKSEKNDDNGLIEEYLCQELIHDSSTLIHGRKFSMRVYVIYFLPTTAPKKDDDDVNIYVSKHGLIKLASTLYDHEEYDINEDMYMTNSGREENMDQLEMTSALQTHVFQNNSHEFNTFWDELKQSIQTVMNIYEDTRIQEQQQKQESSIMDKIGMNVPKIMGFDYIIQKSRYTNTLQPWLLEVNRFPGLQPRDMDGMDGIVKQKVVASAWNLVCQRNCKKKNENSNKMAHDSFQIPYSYLDDSSSSSLEPIVTTRKF